MAKRNKITKRKSSTLTKKEVDFLLTVADILGEGQMKSMITVRILSRISALGLCGGWRELTKSKK